MIPAENGKETPHPRSRGGFPRAAAVAAFVTIAGPPIGALAMVLTPVTYGFRLPSSIDLSPAAVGQALETFVAIAGLAMLYSYVLGTLPAALSGIALGAHVYSGDGSVSMKRALVTAVAASLAAALYYRLAMRADNRDALTMLAFMLPAAALSSLICWWLMRKIGLIRPTVATSLAKP